MDLNDTEMAAILKTWEIPMGDPEESGKVILSRFFERHPHNMKYFTAFQGKTLPEILVDPKFKAHAGRVVRALDNVIRTAEEKGRDAAMSKEIWVRLANNHSKRNITEASFLELKGIIAEVICEVCQLNDFQQKAWEKLLNHVFGIMCQRLVGI